MTRRHRTAWRHAKVSVAHGMPRDNARKVATRKLPQHLLLSPLTSAVTWLVSRQTGQVADSVQIPRNGVLGSWDGNGPKSLGRAYLRSSSQDWPGGGNQVRSIIRTTAIGCGQDRASLPNTNAFNDVTACCSAGVVTGKICGDEDIAATANVTQLCAFVLVSLHPCATHEQIVRSFGVKG